MGMQGDLGWGRGSGGAAGSHRAGHSALLLRPIPEPDDGGGRLGVEGSACEIVGGARLQQNHRAAVDPGVLWGDCGVSRAVSQGVASTTLVTEAPGSVPPSACSPRGRLLPPPLIVTVPVAPGGPHPRPPAPHLVLSQPRRWMRGSGRKLGKSGGLQGIGVQLTPWGPGSGGVS